MTAQELDAALSPTGKQYTYQINSDLGTFSPTTPFASQYVGVTANGYYFDEVANVVSSAPITLNGYIDLSVDSVLNVNVLTTLEYQRIQQLVTKSGFGFEAARRQAENEVLAAFHIPPGTYAAFGTLDISKGSSGDKILAAISSLFVYGNSAGNLASLLAKVQSDIGANGAITDPATALALETSAKGLDPSAIASNLTTRYAAVGVHFTATDISNWIDTSGDGVVGAAAFVVPNAGPTSFFQLPVNLTDAYAGTTISIPGGQMTVNGTATTSAILMTGDVVAVAPAAGTLGGSLTLHLVDGRTSTRNIARVTFVATLTEIRVTSSSASLPVGTTQALHATGTFADGSVADVTANASWTSSNNTVATVGAATGIAKGLSVGQFTVTATIGPVSGSTPLTVTSAVLASVTLNPNPLLTGIGLARPLTATGVLTDGSTVDITSAAVWSSGNSAVVTVTGGLVTGVSIGSTTVTATSGALQGSATVQVASNAWLLATPMNQVRINAVPVLLTGGRVLVAGGRNGAGSGINNSGQQTKAAEIYDPSADAWTTVASMANPREGAATVALKNGKVLVAGGYAVVGGTGGDSTLSEIYDPLTDTWSAAANLHSPHTSPAAAILLSNGKVLVAGGSSAGALVGTSEIYDPATNAWTVAGSLNTPRSGNGIGLVGNGKVLVVGGVDAANMVLRTAELFDPATNLWASAASMASPRGQFGASVLANGKMLAIGGVSGTDPLLDTLDSCEIYDPTTDTWTPTGKLITKRFEATSITLGNGKVLLLGGWEVAEFLSSAEIYDPVSGTWTVAGNLNFARQDARAVALPNGAAIVIGGFDQSATGMTSVEIYLP